MSTYVDWGYGTVDINEVARLGHKGICRYLSNSPGKNLTRKQRDQALHLGLDIVGVWETSAGRSTQGAAAGHLDGLLCGQQAAALQWPKGATLYAATDSDTTWAKVAPYQVAFNAAIAGAGYHGDIYGGYHVITAAVQAGLSLEPWQTTAWSYDENNRLLICPQAVLLQNEYHVPISGVDCDSSEVRGVVNGWQLNRHRAVPTGPTPLLTVGMVGQPVRDVQHALDLLGNDCTKDGVGHFGAETLRVLRLFQSHRSLAQTGTVTPETWRLLRGVVASHRKAS